MADPVAPFRCLVRRHGGDVIELPAGRSSEISDIRAEPETTVWLALRNPGDEELRLLADEFEVHPLALEDVRKRGQRPKLDAYPSQHMLVLYEALATASPKGGVATDFGLAELHLFGGPGWLVSVQWDDSPAIEAGLAQFRRTVDGSARGAGRVVYAIFDGAADSYFPLLDDMAERMDALEDLVLAGGEGGDGDGLREMLAIKRQLLELRRVLGPMRDVANGLLRRTNDLVDDAAEPYFQDLYDHMVRLLDQLDLYRDLLASVLDARLTVTSNALNVIVKRLTAITLIVMVPTLIAGIYGMNFVHMPELDWPLGYPMALGLMVVAVVAAVAYLRSHDWL